MALNSHSSSQPAEAGVQERVARKLENEDKETGRSCPRPEVDRDGTQ